MYKLVNSELINFGLIENVKLNTVSQNTYKDKGFVPVSTEVVFVNADSKKSSHIVFNLGVLLSDEEGLEFLELLLEKVNSSDSKISLNELVEEVRKK